jgi:hypothetical protein
MIKTYLQTRTEGSTMTEGKAGDRLLVDSERVGRAGRGGEILEVLTTAAGVHYRVRWDDGHESTFFPSAGSVKIIEATNAGKEAGA